MTKKKKKNDDTKWVPTHSTRDESGTKKKMGTQDCRCGRDGRHLTRENQEWDP